MKKFLTVILCALAIVCAMKVQTAQAVPMLELSADNGAHWTIVSDGGAGDANPAAGVVTAITSLNGWLINVSTGITMPAVGSTTLPYMDLSSVNVSSSSGTLMIKFIEDGFGPYTGGLYSSAGGTTSGTVEFETFLNGGLISSFGPLSGAFSSSSSTSVSFGAGSTLEMDAIIRHPGKGVTSFDYEPRVPEPATLLIVGTGLVGLALFRRRAS